MGHEKTLTGLIPALAGANLIYGPGMLESGIAFDYAQLVLDSEFIRQLTIEDTYSMVDLPADMPKEIFNDLKKAWVCGQQLKIATVKSQGDGKRRLNQHKKRSGSNKDKGKPRRMKRNNTF